MGTLCCPASPSPLVPIYTKHLVSISQLIRGDQALMGWGLGFPLARRQGGGREGKWRLELTLLLDSGWVISGGLAKPPACPPSMF